MIVKVTCQDQSFKLFDEVKDIKYTDHNTFHPEPPLNADGDMNYLKKFIESVISPKDIAPSNQSSKSLEQPAFKVGAVFGLSAEELSGRQIILFEGEVGKGRHCFKVVSFIRHGEEYLIYTMYPVYICNDAGKTIETIK